MGVTLPTFTNGTTMVSADVRGAATTIRDWTNSNMVVGDVTGDMPTRTFKRGDNILWGGKVQHWMGPSGGYWFLEASDDISERIILHPDAHGMVTSGNGAYMDVSEFSIRYKVPDAGYVDADISWWAWAIGSDQHNAEQFAQCDFFTFLDNPSQDASRRTLWDSGNDASTTQGGQYLYPARQFSVKVRGSVSAGWHSVRLKVNFRNALTKSEYATVYVGARQMLLDYRRK